MALATTAQLRYVNLPTFVRASDGKNINLGVIQLTQLVNTNRLPQHITRANFLQGCASDLEVCVPWWSTFADFSLNDYLLDKRAFSSAMYGAPTSRILDPGQVSYIKTLWLRHTAWTVLSSLLDWIHVDAPSPNITSNIMEIMFNAKILQTNARALTAGTHSWYYGGRHDPQGGMFDRLEDRITPVRTPGNILASSGKLFDDVAVNEYNSYLNVHPESPIVLPIRQCHLTETILSTSSSRLELEYVVINPPTWLRNMTERDPGSWKSRFRRSNNITSTHAVASLKAYLWHATGGGQLEDGWQDIWLRNSIHGHATNALTFPDGTPDPTKVSVAQYLASWAAQPATGYWNAETPGVPPYLQRNDVSITYTNDLHGTRVLNPTLLPTTTVGLRYTTPENYLNDADCELLLRILGAGTTKLVLSLSRQVPKLTSKSCLLLRDRLRKVKAI